MDTKTKLKHLERLSTDSIFEIKYLADAIDKLNKETPTMELMERIRTLELCLLAAARRLAA